MQREDLVMGFFFGFGGVNWKELECEDWRKGVKYSFVELYDQLDMWGEGVLKIQQRRNFIFFFIVLIIELYIWFLDKLLWLRGLVRFG